MSGSYQEKRLFSTVNTSDGQESNLNKHIDDLPEELTVVIFSYFSPCDIVNIVTKVNRKWNRLSHDKKLWSQMSIETQDINIIVKVMNFAPCLRSICIKEMNVQNEIGEKSLQILTQGPCRVRSLSLPDFLPISLRIIRNQLGYLRHLHLDSWWDHGRHKYSDDMWKMIFEMDLLSLTLREYDGFTSYFHSGHQPLPGQLGSLRHLDLYCKQVPGGILAALLEACKGTLETVALPPKTKGADVALLSKCPRLREANVPFMREVCALEKNPVLEMVEMNSESLTMRDIQLNAKDVELFLRMPAVVNRLRTLIFQGMPTLCRQLLHVTAGVRNLRYLLIHNFGQSESVDAILEVLEKVPHLERLGIDVLPPPAVLDAIASHFCPNLRELSFIGACSDDDQRCRIPAIKRLLKQRPHLHVFLELGLGVVRQYLEGSHSECLLEHRDVCSDKSRWHRVHPVLVNHVPDACDWCRHKVEFFATVVDMRGKLGPRTDEDLSG